MTPAELTLTSVTPYPLPTFHAVPCIYPNNKKLSIAPLPVLRAETRARVTRLTHATPTGPNHQNPAESSKEYNGGGCFLCRLYRGCLLLLLLLQQGTHHPKSVIRHQRQSPRLRQQNDEERRQGTRPTRTTRNNPPFTRHRLKPLTTTDA